jgi:hypothetical protein
MSFAPPPAPMAALGPINPIEMLINGLNTNQYLIGLSMILLNLGGRHLSMGLTQQQDQFFQNPWMRRAMLFVVIFVATRNVFTALWLSIALVLIIGYLFNEHSGLYLFGPPVQPPAAAKPPPGLTGEEQEILKRLQDKASKAGEAEALTDGSKAGAAAAPKTVTEQLSGWYRQNMRALRTFIS